MRPPEGPPPAGGGSVVLDVRDLAVTFRTRNGPVPAVRGVSLRVERGRTAAILGESGCGKTTVALALLDSLPEGTQVEGSLHLNGQDLRTLAPARRRALNGDRISMVHQDALAVLDPMQTVGNHLVEIIRAHRPDTSRASAAAQAVDLLGRVGIPSPKQRADDYPHEFSGGMRQRVTIAIALACGPHLLFADEPTTALDVTVQAQILNLLQEQQRDRHMAMVLVTHDLGVVAGRTDDIAVMYAGQIVERAPTRTLFANVRMPYTEALLKSIPKLEEPSHTRLQIIGGRPPDLVNPPHGCRFAPRCPYAQPKCHAEMPPLVEAETPGHEYRCWFPVGTEAGREALERNLAHHVPAAEAAVTGDSHAAGLVDTAELAETADHGGEA